MNTVGGAVVWSRLSASGWLPSLESQLAMWAMCVPLEVGLTEEAILAAATAKVAG